MTVLKRLKDDKKVSLLGQLDSKKDDIKVEEKLFKIFFHFSCSNENLLCLGTQKHPKLKKQLLLYNIASNR